MVYENKGLCGGYHSDGVGVGKTAVVVVVQSRLRWVAA